MKPAPFDYLAPTTLDHAIDAIDGMVNDEREVKVLVLQPHLGNSAAPGVVASSGAGLVAASPA